MRSMVVIAAAINIGFESFFLYLLEYRAISQQREPVTGGALLDPVNRSVSYE